MQGLHRRLVAAVVIARPTTSMAMKMWTSAIPSVAEFKWFN